jgi:hypothetical protein
MVRSSLGSSASTCRTSNPSLKNKKLCCKWTCCLIYMHNVHIVAITQCILICCQRIQRKPIWI